MIDNQTKFRSFLDKIIIVLFYLSIIFLLLYLPMLKDHFLKTDNVINVYTYTDMISSSTAKEFEAKTGIRINLKYYDTNEELYAKFKVGGGKGYDLITPSDYLTEYLIKNNVLHKIDKSRLNNYKELDSRLTGQYFDINNDFSIPYFWSVDGIVFNKKKIKDLNIDWDFVFKNTQKSSFKICMLDNLREAFFISSIYLLGKTKNYSEQDFIKIKNMLIAQKSWVEAYLYASLQYYLLSDVVPLAVTTSAFARKILEVSDDFEFIIPDVGSLFVIDNLAIPKECKKTDLVYKFIDFLISKEIIIKNANHYGYNPANKESYSLIDPKFLNNKNFFPDDEMFQRLHLIHNDFDVKKVEKLWLEVKLF